MVDSYYNCHNPVAYSLKHQESKAVAVEFVNLRLRYGVRKPYVLDGLNLSVPSGRITVLIGPSGCAKTTLLRTAAGFLRPNVNKRKWFRNLLLSQTGEYEMEGRVLFDDADVTATLPQHRHVAMVRQTWDLLPHLTVREALLLPMRLNGVDPREAQSRIQWVTQNLGLSKVLDQRPNELSGGETQRVALGRLLVRPDARLYLFDECLNSLDPSLRKEMIRLIQTLLQEQRVTTIWVTHLVEEARCFADNLAVMYSGRILQTGTFEEVEASPRCIEVFKILNSLTDEYVPKVLLRNGTFEWKGISVHLPNLDSQTGCLALAIPRGAWRHHPQGRFTGKVTGFMRGKNGTWDTSVAIDNLCNAEIALTRRPNLGDSIRLDILGSSIDAFPCQI